MGERGATIGKVNIVVKTGLHSNLTRLGRRDECDMYTQSTCLRNMSISEEEIDISSHLCWSSGSAIRVA